MPRKNCLAPLAVAPCVAVLALLLFAPAAEAESVAGALEGVLPDGRIVVGGWPYRIYPERAQQVRDALQGLVDAGGSRVRVRLDLDAQGRVAAAQLADIADRPPSSQELRLDNLERGDHISVGSVGYEVVAVDPRAGIINARFLAGAGNAQLVGNQLRDLAFDTSYHRPTPIPRNLVPPEFRVLAVGDYFELADTTQWRAMGNPTEVGIPAIAAGTSQQPQVVPWSLFQPGWREISASEVRNRGQETTTQIVTRTRLFENEQFAVDGTPELDNERNRTVLDLIITSKVTTIVVGATITVTFTSPETLASVREENEARDQARFQSPDDPLGWLNQQAGRHWVGSSLSDGVLVKTERCQRIEPVSLPPLFPMRVTRVHMETEAFQPQPQVEAPTTARPRTVQLTSQESLAIIARGAADENAATAIAAVSVIPGTHSVALLDLLIDRAIQAESEEVQQAARSTLAGWDMAEARLLAFLGPEPPESLDVMQESGRSLLVVVRDRSQALRAVAQVLGQARNEHVLPYVVELLASPFADRREAGRAYALAAGATAVRFLANHLADPGASPTIEAVLAELAAGDRSILRAALDGAGLPQEGVPEGVSPADAARDVAGRIRGSLQAAEPSPAVALDRARRFLGRFAELARFAERRRAQAGVPTDLGEARGPERAAAVRTLQDMLARDPSNTAVRQALAGHYLQISTELTGGASILDQPSDAAVVLERPRRNTRLPVVPDAPSHPGWIAVTWNNQTAWISDRVVTVEGSEAVVHSARPADDSLAYAQIASRLDPTQAQAAYRAMARTYLDQGLRSYQGGDFSEAHGFFGQAIACDPAIADQTKLGASFLLSSIGLVVLEIVLAAAFLVTGGWTALLEVRERSFRRKLADLR